jgi:flagellar biosynthesis GTPase FlhF
VAFVGAGGAGKTRAAAAMAIRYAKASTLRVTVVSLAPGSHPGDAAALLDGREIEVQALSGEAVAETVAVGRERGLVVIDTPATSPVDAGGIAALAADLGGAGLDAVYLTVPATLSASAARNLLDGLAPLAPTALVITHADETEDVGVAAELAYQTGLPIAFINDGLELETALTIGVPARVAERVLGEPANG